MVGFVLLRWNACMSASERAGDFSLKIDFRKNSENPSRVFETVTNLIERFGLLDDWP